MEPTAALRGDIGDALRRVGFPIAVIDSTGRVAWQNDARRLGISEETVRNHIRGIFRRLGVHSRLEAVVRAHELGLL